MDFVSRVRPELRDALNQMEAFNLKEDLDSFRQSPLPPFPPPEQAVIREIHIPGADGQPMRVRIHEPANRPEGKIPALLWIHGGGYVLGDPAYDDNQCHAFVEAAGCYVFAPDYRLAPEHPFPAGLEDCYATLKWIHESAEEFGIDTDRVAVAGPSAGGGLTAALSLLARDRGGPAICFQMPLYPMLDDRNTLPSTMEITYPKIWNRQNNIVAWNMYLGGKTDDVSPYAAPARAENLTGLPPTYTCIGQLDLFRDETIEYVARLAQAGVDVEFHLYPGGYHAFEVVAWDAEVSVRARNDYVRALVEAFNRRG